MAIVSRNSWWLDTEVVGWTFCNLVTQEWNQSKRIPSSLSMQPLNSLLISLNLTFRYFHFFFFFYKCSCLVSKKRKMCSRFKNSKIKLCSVNSGKNILNTFIIWSIRVKFQDFSSFFVSYAVQDRFYLSHFAANKLRFSMATCMDSSTCRVLFL